MKFKVKLRVTSPQGKKNKYSLNLEEGAKFTLGKGSAGLVLEHPTVSASHCYLTVRKGTVSVFDNRSKNGISLNNKKIQSSPVRTGDLLQVSDFSIEFLDVPVSQQELETGTQFIDVANLSPQEYEEYKERSRMITRSETVTPTTAPSKEPKNQNLKSSGQNLRETQKTDHTGHHIPEGSLSLQDVEAEGSELILPDPDELLKPEKSVAPLPQRPDALLGSHQKVELDSEFSAQHESAHPYKGRPQEQDPSYRRFQGPKIDKELLLPFLLIAAGSAATGAISSARSGEVDGVNVIISTVIGLVLTSVLAAVLNIYSDFMESEGDFKSYLGFLSYGILPFIPVNYFLGHSLFWKTLASFGVILGIFHLFRKKFQPLFEKAVFVLSAYFFGIIALAQLWNYAQSRLSNPANPVTGSVATTKTEPPATAAPLPFHVQKDPIQQHMEAQAQAQAAASAEIPDTPSPSSAPREEISANLIPRPELDPFAVAQLLKAAEVGNLAVVRNLVEEKKLSPEASSDNKRTPLSLAASSGHLEIVKYLVSQYANVNAADSNGTTPLMWATYAGNKAIVDFLIRSGADLNARRNDGDRSIEIARRWGRSDIAWMLEHPFESAPQVQTRTLPRARRFESEKNRAPAAIRTKSFHSREKE